MKKAIEIFSSDCKRKFTWRGQDCRKLSEQQECNGKDKEQNRRKEELQQEDGWTAAMLTQLRTVSWSYFWLN